MILNPFKCPKCKNPLQPEDVGVKVENGKLIRICKYCGDEFKIEETK
jgi:transcription elongation factor Elf1